MIECARPYEQNMCELYYPITPPAPARLDDFQVFRKGAASHAYADYYAIQPYEAYADPDIESTVNVYHTMMACRDYPRDDWKKKYIVDWTEEDSVAWIIDTIQCMGISEFEVPYHNFRISGVQLRGLKREDVQQRMMHLSIEPSVSRRIADNIFEKLHIRLHDDAVANAAYDRPMFRYGDTMDLYQQEPAQTVLDLDSIDHKNRYSNYTPNDTRLLGCDSSDDQEDVFRSRSENASPECSYGSDGSKSGDEDRKMPKRPPGRPKGSGRKMVKRPRSVSVPEFLRNLLFDPKFCPSIIKWEDHTLGKFRFVKPDEVAKLWGKMKQNDNMTFEKFSRAMRYHYRQAVLVSVPTARLVYQFGHKGPDFKTDNPNFVKIKSEMDSNVDAHCRR